LQSERASVARMSGKAVELSVAGQNCRVVTTADAQELQLLATMVEEKLAGVIASGRPVTTQAMLLAAVALAAEVQTQRARADAIADKAKTALSAMLERVDAALEHSEARPADSARKRAKSTASKDAATGGSATGGSDGTDTVATGGKSKRGKSRHRSDDGE
jgi:cell division protein ZapA